MLVEEIRNRWTGKGTRDARGAVDTKVDHAITQSRHVGNHDLDHVDHPNVARPVQNVRADVLLDGVAGCLEDHAHDADGDHDDEALDSAPNVDDFGEGKGRDAADDGG
jgi:hypothetical protein